MSSDQQYPYDPRAGSQTGQSYDPEVTQTWQGQTWDTQYQPTVQPQAPASYDSENDNAYPPPQGQYDYAPQPVTGGHPLPPEAPAAYEAPAAARQAYEVSAPAPQAYEVPAAAPQAYEAPAAARQAYEVSAPAPQAYEVPAAAPQASYEPQAPQAYEVPVAAPQASYESQAPQAYDVSAPAPQASYETPAPAAPASVAAPAAPASVLASAAEYSVPTTSGTARVTDAQRARAEGRSPIIEPGMQPAALTAVLGVLLAGGAAFGSYALLVPLLLLQALTAAGWFRLNGMWPARQGIALAFLGGVVADAALLAVGREHAPGAIIGTLGVWVLLTLVLQLRSHADPDERMYGLMATVVSSALAILAAGHLGADPDAVVVGAVAVAAAVLARAVPLPGPVSVVVALLAAAGGGIAAGGFTGLGTGGALLGLGAGVCALVGLRVASYDYPSRFVHMTAGVALPLTAAVPAVYLLGRVLA
ncbi:hypothetical protein ACIRSU_32670 [Streptomyces sp. NPDC101160]|uniref:hypothetical protein n=1 Tax=Streptomyces sp. NPDC101160 TaxID=3366118 RepID=UPI00380BABEB